MFFGDACFAKSVVLGAATRMQTPCGRVGEAYKTRNSHDTFPIQAERVKRQGKSENYRREHAGDELAVCATAPALVRARSAVDDAEGNRDQSKKRRENEAKTRRKTRMDAEKGRKKGGGRAGLDAMAAQSIRAGCR